MNCGTRVRTISINADLDGLTLSDSKLSPDFASAVTNYAVSVPFEISSLSVTPVLADGTASVRVNGLSVESGCPSQPVALSVGNNTISVSIMAQDRVSLKTYTVDVVRLPGTNADLAWLGVSEGALSPAFASAVTSYSVSVPFATSALSVTPVPADDAASANVNGVNVASENASPPMALSVGSNAVPVVVTAQDGASLKTYMLNVTRLPSANADLAGLAVSGGTLSPGFTSAVTNYSVSVPFSTRALSVTPVLADAAASVMVNGGSVASGSASTPVPLSVGSNAVPVVVTAQDGVTQRRYMVGVNRSAEASLWLQGLSLSASPLSPLFEAGTLVYQAKVLNHVRTLTVTAKAEQSDATIRVNGQLVSPESSTSLVALSEGLNTINVEVSPKGSSSVRVYVVNVLRQPEFGGGYNGMIRPTRQSPAPAEHIGIGALSVTPLGAFSGKMSLGGTATALPFSGYFDASGVAQFKMADSGAASPALRVLRAGVAPLSLGMHADWQSPLTHRVVGEVRSGSLMVASFVLNRRLYTSNSKPKAPLRNVPLSVRDPAREKGNYTVLLPALKPEVQGKLASAYPQGSGFATASVEADGAAYVYGELADGQLFSYKNYLSKDNVLPVFVPLYGGRGSFGGDVFFREVSKQSDADGLNLDWFKQRNLADPLYPEGWPSGIALHLFGSKFLGAAVTTKTVLGNEAVVYPKVNGWLSLHRVGLLQRLRNKLTIGRTSVQVQGAPAGETAALQEQVAFSSTGRISGSFVPAGAGRGDVLFRGAVFQKTQQGAGYFLMPSPNGGKMESGSLSVISP